MPGFICISLKQMNTDKEESYTIKLLMHIVSANNNNFNSCQSVVRGIVRIKHTECYLEVIEYLVKNTINYLVNSNRAL